MSRLRPPVLPRRIRWLAEAARGEGAVAVWYAATGVCKVYLYWGMRLAQYLAGALPRWISFGMAALVGEAVYYLWPAKSQALVDNMAQVLDSHPEDRRVKAAARRCFRNYGKYLVEFFRMPRLTPTDLGAALSQVHGWEHVDAALAHGRGTIFVTAHFGNWDVAGAFFALRHPVSVVVERFHPERLNDLVQGTRTAKGMAVIPLEHAARQVLRVLRRNEIVGLVIDRPVHGQQEGVPVRFFGRETRWPAGAAALAMKTGAVVLPAGCWRNSDNSYSGVVAPPIHCEATGDSARDLQRNMQRIVDALEQIIRPHPDQWYMFRAMWPAAS